MDVDRPRRTSLSFWELARFGPRDWDFDEGLDRCGPSHVLEGSYCADHHALPDVGWASSLSSRSRETTGGIFGCSSTHLASDTKHPRTGVPLTFTRRHSRQACVGDL
jgi:hypothetical protein